MNTATVRIKATLHEDASRVLVEETDIHPAYLDAPELWIPEANLKKGQIKASGSGKTLTKYAVTERQYQVDDRNTIVHLRLKPVQAPFTERVLEWLSNLKGDRTVWVASVLASVSSVGVAALAIFLATHPLLSLGFLANHADAAAGWSVAIYLFWAAMRQKYRVLELYLGFVWAMAGILTWLAVNTIWPEATSDAAADQGYEALGTSIYDNWGNTVAALAPWLPTAVILVKALGFDTASSLIDKNLRVKGK